MHKFAFLSVHAGVKKWGERAKEAIKDGDKAGGSVFGDKATH